jgi:hypothetical protein
LAAKDMARILNDCRDLAIHRLLLSFTSMLDRVGDLLMSRAERSDIREEQTLYLDARGLLVSERNNLMADFERHLRALVDERMSGRVEPKPDFASFDMKNATLVDTTAMDESVLSSNIVRVVENQCESELRELNRGVGFLLGRPDLETAANPLAPTTIVEAFTDALHDMEGEQRIKLTILKELNQTSLGDINDIYADLNRHLEGLNVVPKTKATIVNRSGAERAGADSKMPPADGAAPPVSGGDIDLMAVLQRLAGAGAAMRGTSSSMLAGLPAGGIHVPQAGPGGGYAPHEGGQGFGPSGAGMQGGYPGQGGMQGGYVGQGGFAGGQAGGDAASGSPAMTGPFGGQRILVTPELGDALVRLQHGESGFQFAGAPLHVAGLQQDMHNVLRELQDSPVGAHANQLEAMTIELVAMLFDFIFETKDLPDSIKALIGRLQIPVLKAAMLDGAFFSKKSHPSRLLVNALARAGIGWSPTMGHDDPLYRKVESIVHRILDDFADDVALFDTMREELDAFLAEEDKRAEVSIASSAEEIDARDRAQIAQVMATAEIERRLQEYPTPNFLATFLRDKWRGTLAQLYQQEGEESEAWTRSTIWCGACNPNVPPTIASA